ncbi:uncharacterized protein EI97DRAFT_369102 [Westerdykella ornata]|uniref:DUF4396 domain-containing protein n=1 Tax=Westerdykella ornata TaxID=318751 RepID=A0A6A6JW48_WESOR|nr:uncharacterized protein EI97DRAFT_369102 [Westerdykella ornata]KAF2280038.1 hypothetical protein EI97DRAFT_369102 [Westerdykella ornata]
MCRQGSLGSHRRPKSSMEKTTASSCSKAATSSSPTKSQFWTSGPTWRRAALNTLRCLAGCTVGDFSAMWYLQAFHPAIGMEAIMVISMAAGISSSMLLETALLRFGRDRLPWVAAAKTAGGMSIISMVTMELAENTVDYHLTGGLVQFDSPAFWAAAVLSVSTGFIAPLPYNYLRLRKYSKACH